MVAGRTPEPLAETVALIRGRGRQAVAHSADVTRPTRWPGAAAALERWGRIDVLVNNAGIDDETPFLEMQEESWRAVVDTNLTGAFLMSQRVAREMGGRRRRDPAQRLDRRVGRRRAVRELQRLQGRACSGSTARWRWSSPSTASASTASALASRTPT